MRLLLLCVFFGSVSAAEFPTDANDYDPATTVAMDKQTLATLDDKQLGALLEFAGSCGRVLLIGVTPEVQEIFLNRAACGARYLIAAATTDDLQALFRTLAELPEPDHASAAELEALLSSSAAFDLNLARLGLFWSAFLLILIALLLTARTRLAALGFCIATTLLVPAVWPAATTWTFVAWAEAASSDRVVAYHALERLRFYQDGKYSVEDTQSRGSFAVKPVLETAFNDGGITLCNRGTGVSATTHIYWHGDVYELPPMKAGGRWKSTSEQALDTDDANTPELALFRERSSKHELTTLRPLQIADRAGHAWLLQYDTPRLGVDACAM
jgi:hypothetical protein